MQGTTPVRLLAVALDVTSRRLAQEELVRSEATLQLAQAGTGLGAWDWNIETDEVQRTSSLYEILPSASSAPPATYAH